MFDVEINNRQSALPVDEPRLVRAVSTVLEGEGVAEAAISVAVVDDATIEVLNRRHLNHEGPTDVLSFLLENADDHLEGEIVVSGQMAARTAPEYGWPAGDELLLYLIHGTLHLLGFDDQDDPGRAAMRARESHYLVQLGCCPATVARHASQASEGPAAGPTTAERRAP